jgi:hypothetical protein
MKYYVVFTNGMAMLYYKMLTRDRLALGEVVFVKLLSEPAKGICPSSDCDGSVVHSRMRMGGWSERMVGDQLDDRANDPQDICQRLVVYRIIWHTVPWSYNPFPPLLIRWGMVLYVSMVLY